MKENKIESEENKTSKNLLEIMQKEANHSLINEIENNESASPFLQSLEPYKDEILNKIKDLLAKGANPNYSENDQTCLAEAIKCGAGKTVVGMLLESKADPNKSSCLYWSLLKNDKVAELLIEYGANPNDLTQKNHSIFYMYLDKRWSPNLSVIKSMIQHGASQKILGEFGEKILNKILKSQEDSQQHLDLALITLSNMNPEKIKELWKKNQQNNNAPKFIELMKCIGEASNPSEVIEHLRSCFMKNNVKKYYHGLSDKEKHSVLTTLMVFHRQKKGTTRPPKPLQERMLTQAFPFSEIMNSPEKVNDIIENTLKKFDQQKSLIQKK